MEVPDTALDEPLLQRSKQDPRAQQQTLDWGCALNLAKVITGAGMMAIPRAFLQIGWLPGTIMLVGVALLTFFTLAVLVQGSAATQASTYGELVCRTCGVGMMRLLQLAVLLFCFGFSVVYLVSGHKYRISLLTSAAIAGHQASCSVSRPAVHMCRISS
jgi:amino acid permease